MRAFVAGVAVVVLVGCSGGGNKAAVAIQSSGEGTTTTTTEATTTTVQSDASKNADAYVKSVVAGKVAEYQTAVDVSAPGSAAHAYAVAQQAQAKASVQSGTPQTPATTKVLDDGSIQACFGAGTSQEQCLVFNDFEAGTDGLLTNLTVQGKPLAGRAIEGNGQQVNGAGGTVTLLAAFEGNTTDDLLVLVEYAAGADKLMAETFSATYVNPDGSQIKSDPAQSISAGGEVQPGAKVIEEAAFPTATVGGRMTVTLCPSSFKCVDANLNIA